MQIEEIHGVDTLATVIMNFECDFIEEYDELVAALDKCEYRFKPKKSKLDMNNRESPHVRPFGEEAPKLEHKPLHITFLVCVLG